MTDTLPATADAIEEAADLLRRVREANAMAPTATVAQRQAEALDEAGLLVTVGVLREAFLAGLIGSDEPSARDDEEDEERFVAWYTDTAL